MPCHDPPAPLEDDIIANQVEAVKLLCESLRLKLDCGFFDLFSAIKNPRMKRELEWLLEHRRIDALLTGKECQYVGAYKYNPAEHDKALADVAKIKAILSGA